MSTTIRNIIISYGSVTPTRAPALPTPAPALLDSPRGGSTKNLLILALNKLPCVRPHFRVVPIQLCTYPLALHLDERRLTEIAGGTFDVPSKPILVRTRRPTVDVTHNKKLELGLSIDLLLCKTCKDFDEGDAWYLLMNHLGLGVGSDGGHACHLCHPGGDITLPNYGGSLQDVLRLKMMKFFDYDYDYDNDPGFDNDFDGDDAALQDAREHNLLAATQRRGGFDQNLSIVPSMSDGMLQMRLLLNKKFPWEGMDEHGVYYIVGIILLEQSAKGLAETEIIDLLEWMFPHDPNDRPTMSEVVILRRLLHFARNCTMNCIEQDGLLYQFSTCIQSSLRKFEHFSCAPNLATTFSVIGTQKRQGDRLMPKHQRDGFEGIENTQLPSAVKTNLPPDTLSSTSRGPDHLRSCARSSWHKIRGGCMHVARSARLTSCWPKTRALYST
ncbi:uncharacterized protein F5147DRAFT_654907 [Suillus discolor]|uniref:Uncharacterized protein n=1 Tax=Suillus discolor TaxID=1912936 RepID=A0A9P7JRP4_9AGAM|nr:uncharacterized protein F5147DRAFT_654907 [Suillus discolor]KAG2102824.1 hypothetical protein F5147DRAFT_654907 [Suillus discolor]